MRADPVTYTLASNVSATGSAVAVKGGIYMFAVDGTLGGSTATLQSQLPDETWANVQAYPGSTGLSITEAPMAVSPVYLPAGNYRMALTGGAPTAIYSYLMGIG